MRKRQLAVFFAIALIGALVIGFIPTGARVTINPGSSYLSISTDVVLAVSTVDEPVSNPAGNPPMTWLSGWDNRVNFTIDHDNIDSPLTWFPVRVHLSASIIDVGEAATDRATFLADSLTTVNKGNPVLADGTITSIEIYAVSGEDLSGCKVGIFYLTNGDTLKCRSSVTIGNVTGGSKQTFTEDSESNPISLSALVGDYIGTYYSGGELERDTTGGSDIWFRSGDYCDVDDEIGYTVSADDALSLYGTGSSGVDVSCVFDEVGANSTKIAITKADGTTELYGEVENWDDTNETANIWVSRDGWSISNTTNTTGYLYYDNDHADNDAYIGIKNSTPAQSVWDANFKGVYHMADGVDNTAIYDSTDSNNDGSKTGTDQPEEVASAVAYAQDFDPDEKIALGQPITGYPFSLSGFVYANTDPIVRDVVLSISSGTDAYYHALFVEVGNGTANAIVRSYDGTVRDANFLGLEGQTWYYLQGVWASDSSRKIYVNGDLKTEDTGTEDGDVGYTRTYAGVTADSTPLGYIDGLLDELRASDAVRNDAWAKADYESIRDHLLTWGSEETVINITNIPSSRDFGTVIANTTNETGLTAFNVTNTGDVAVNISIKGTNMTGGTQWTLNDTATPGADIYGLKAGLAQNSSIGDEMVDKRTASSKTHWLGGTSYAWDGTIGSIHYWDAQWKEIDNIFEPTTAPWNWQMLKAGYHIKVKEDFTAGQIIEFEKQGETVQFQPMALEWTNDLDQIQPVSMPQNITPVITNPEVDLLPAVGMPSHQGTIKWNNGYGEGLDFEWRCTSTRLVKILEIENFNKLPIPEQWIVDGGNPVLRLNLIFDPSDIDIYVDGEVWDKKIKKQTFNVIEFRKDGEVLWGFMPLRYWGSGAGEDNEGLSIATLEKRGNSLYISIRVPYEWLQSAVYPVFIDTDVDEQVGADTDTCFRRLASGYDAWAVGGPYGPGFAAGADSDAAQAGGGARFTTVAISPDIDTAHLILTARADRSGTVVRTRISAEDVDDAPTFADDKDIFDARWANRTTARMDWDAIGAWTDHTVYNSPTTDGTTTFASIIQEIVDRGGWESGNDIVIFWEDFEDRSDHNIATYRDSETYYSESTDAPKLHIEYTEVEDYDIIVKLNSPYNNLCTNLSVNATKSWGLKLYTPTSFGDGYEKTGTVTLTATEYT